ncbi:MAG: 4Fe-4S binding protein [Spirochaetia bacterium]|nr:4Fe-4S binding protein [Spirochaetia bacterium]
MIQKQHYRTAALVSVFVLMCMFRLWYTIGIIFAAGLILTLKDRRRSFCVDYCPMATVQQAVYRQKDPGHDRLLALLQRRWFKVLVAIGFWGYLIAVLILFRGDPQLLWSSLLSLMLGSMAIALILQSLVRKRVWCSTICPYGKVLEQVVTIGRRSVIKS